jgi:hypothetical protein
MHRKTKTYFPLSSIRLTDAGDHVPNDSLLKSAANIERRPPQYSVVRSESTVARQSQGVASAAAAEFASPTSRQHDFAPKFYRPQQSSNANQQAAAIAGRYNNVRTVRNDESILGSGDFLLIRGGTFDSSNGGSLLGNGFGREAQASKASRKEPHYPANPFENFKDFADIAGDPAYSHFVIVYDNGESSTRQPKIRKAPKNIFEKLQLIDQENEEISKLSKGKLKLAKTKFVGKKKYGSKYESKSIVDSYDDPLMAVN